MVCSTFPARTTTPRTTGRRSPPAKTAAEKSSTIMRAHAVVEKMIDGKYPVFLITFTNAAGKTFTGRWNSTRPLLSANSKLKKAAGRFRAIGLALAPWQFAGGGNLCGAASAGCIDACNGLWSGMNVTSSTRFALIGRARLWLEFRALFLEKLRDELRAFERLCIRTGRIPAVRLNVSSDIPFEKIAPWIFTEFHRTRFYDYSAYTVEKRGTLPSNYELCHSWKETTRFDYVASVIAAGRNIVVPFDSAYAPQRHLFGALPEKVIFRCRETGLELIVPVVNGDRHDIRTARTDGRGVCLGLHGKSGRGRVDAAVDAGFMRHHAEGSTLRRKTIHRGVVVVVC